MDTRNGKVLGPAAAAAPAPGGGTGGSTAVPDPLLDTSTVQVLTDSGDTSCYGDGVIARDELLELRSPPADRS